MNDLRIVLFQSHLTTLRDTIALFTEEECIGETLYSLHSILMMLNERINKRLASRARGRYRITLRLHEAIALRRAALVGIALYTDLHKQNDLRMVVVAIDPLLPVNCKPY